MSDCNRPKVVEMLSDCGCNKNPQPFDHECESLFKIASPLEGQTLQWSEDFNAFVNTYSSSGGYSVNTQTLGSDLSVVIADFTDIALVGYSNQTIILPSPCAYRLTKPITINSLNVSSCVVNTVDGNNILGKDFTISNYSTLICYCVLLENNSYSWIVNKIN